MANWKLIVAGFFSLLGTISFLRIVGNEVQLQKRMLEWEKLCEEEAAHKEAMMLHVAKEVPTSVTPLTDTNAAEAS